MLYPIYFWLVKLKINFKVCHLYSMETVIFHSIINNNIKVDLLTTNYLKLLSIILDVRY